MSLGIDALACENLTLGHRLKGITFSLPAGHSMALVGPNGAGKSTLLQALAGLLRVEGRIHWNGVLISKITFLERARLLSWVGQENHVEFAFPVRDLVSQGRYPWHDDDQGIQEAMNALDIAPLAHRPITELSSGERRRVFLARALATTAPIQLWDEPTSNLDVRHGLEVVALAKRLTQTGSTFLVSLHDLNQAMRFDRVAVLKEGELVAFGKPKEVLSSDLIRFVFRVEARIGEGLQLEIAETLL